MSPYLPGAIPWLDDDEEPAPLDESAEQFHISTSEISWSWFPDLD